MPRRDLSEWEIADLKLIVREPIDKVSRMRIVEMVDRLAGEVLALREREAWDRQNLGVEGDY